jgi:hypothetical protein
VNRSEQNPYHAPRDAGVVAKPQSLSKSALGFWVSLQVAGAGLAAFMFTCLGYWSAVVDEWGDLLEGICSVGVVLGLLAFVTGLLTAAVFGAIWIGRRF